MEAGSALQRSQRGPGFPSLRALVALSETVSGVENQWWTNLLSRASASPCNDSSRLVCMRKECSRAMRQREIGELGRLCEDAKMGMVVRLRLHLRQSLNRSVVLAIHGGSTSWLLEETHSDLEPEVRKVCGGEITTHSRILSA